MLWDNVSEHVRLSQLRHLTWWLIVTKIIAISDLTVFCWLTIAFLFGLKDLKLHTADMTHPIIQINDWHILNIIINKERKKEHGTLILEIANLSDRLLLFLKMFENIWKSFNMETTMTIMTKDLRICKVIAIRLIM